MKTKTRVAQAIIDVYMRICDGNNEIRKNIQDKGTINSNILHDTLKRNQIIICKYQKQGDDCLIESNKYIINVSLSDLYVCFVRSAGNC